LISTTLTDAQRKIIAPDCLGRECDPGRTGPDPRLFVEVVLWIARTGCPWRDLPVEFGGWNTVFKRFRRWVKADAFYRIFRALAEDADFEYTMIDGTITKVHRHGQGANRGTQCQAIGHSRGGMTSKIMALTDALGSLIDFRLLPCQAHALRGTAALIDGLSCGQLLADHAFGTNWLREALSAAKIEAVIPPKSNRRFPAEFDKETYKRRHLIDLRRRNDPLGSLLLLIFQKIKEYRGIATRFCKTDTS